MALYIPAGHRRRKLGLAAAAALLVGLAVGGIIGRATAPSLTDQITTAQQSGRKLATSLQVLPLEYRKVYDANAGQASGAKELIDRSLADYETTMQSAPWLTPAARSPADAAIDAIREAPSHNVPPDSFDERVAQATAAIETAFGLPPSR